MKNKVYAFDRGVFNPYKTKNIEFLTNECIKENEVLFKEDFFNEDNPKLWEVRYDNSYPNVFFDENIQKYRCYYSTFTKDDESFKYSLEERKQRDYKPKSNRIVSLCYAESSDGKNFVKPNLNLTKFNGSKENNILFHYVHGTSIFYDKHEKSEEKKYKMFTKIDYGNGIHFLAVAFSKDGINFSDFIKLDFNPRADTHNSVFFDEKINKYVLITRNWRDSMRVSEICFSDDFINWYNLRETGLTRDYENQIYSMPLFKEGDYILGLASVFHEGDIDDIDYDKVDLFLTYSYNYNSFLYTGKNVFIKRGEGDYKKNNTPDSGCIYCSLPVKINNRTYFYYMGGNGRHTNFRETSLMRAYIENDRYSYIQRRNKEKSAYIFTNEFIILDDNLYFDCKIESKEDILIKVYDKDYEFLKELDFEIFEDSIKINIDKEFIRKDIRFKIEIKNAKIYSIYGNFYVKRIETSNTLLRE